MGTQGAHKATVSHMTRTHTRKAQARAQVLAQGTDTDEGKALTQTHETAFIATVTLMVTGTHLGRLFQHRDGSFEVSTTGGEETHAELRHR